LNSETFNAGSVAADHVAKWNGSSWEALKSGMNDRVLALAVDGSGNLYAGGDFTMAGAGGVAASRIARWNAVYWAGYNGKQWSEWNSLGGYTPSAPGAAIYQPGG